MKRKYRVILISIIIIFAVLDLYSLIDIISKFYRQINDLFSFVRTELAFIFLILILLFIFSIPSLMFNLKVLKSNKIESELDILDNGACYDSIFLKNKILWYCNVFLGIIYLLLGGYLIFGMISPLLKQDISANKILFSMMFILLGIVMIKDSLVIKNN